MAVITVTGEISENELGVTDIHEHILCDFSKNHIPPTEITKIARSEEKVTLENLGVVLLDPAAIKDNLVLSDEALAINELIEYKKAGGKTIVDLTTLELRRDPVALRNIARTLDINIITCTGYYIQQYHLPFVKNMTVEEIVEVMMKEILNGIEDTGVRAGIIGEVGTSDQIYPDEEKVLVAAAMVNKKLGAPVMVHTDPQHLQAPSALKILDKNGCSLKKVSICHMDSNFFDDAYYKTVLKTGAYIEFDTFGEHFCLHPNYGPSDLDRVKSLRRLIDMGYVNQIMLGNDICLKCRLHRYGGWGYDHLLNNVLSAMKREGIKEEQIDTMLIENPKHYLNLGN